MTYGPAVAVSPTRIAIRAVGGNSAEGIHATSSAGISPNSFGHRPLSPLEAAPVVIAPPLQSHLQELLGGLSCVSPYRKWMHCTCSRVHAIAIRALLPNSCASL